MSTEKIWRIGCLFFVYMENSGKFELQIEWGFELWLNLDLIWIELTGFLNFNRIWISLVGF